MKKLAIVGLIAGSLFGRLGLAAEESVYAGEENREIKALSSEEVAGLLTGKGLGYAKAAELNGYPGPAHVLALGEELGLSAERREQTRAIFERMETTAMKLGEELVASERELDEMFRNQTVTERSIAEKLAQIGALQAQLREVHLRAHLEQTRIMSAEQISRYRQLRGYEHGVHEHQEHRHHGG